MGLPNRGCGGNGLIPKYIGSAFDDVKTVADNIDDVITVADNIGVIETNAANVATVAEEIDNVVDVGENIDDVKVVAENISSVVTVGDNVEAIKLAVDVPRNMGAYRHGLLLETLSSYCTWNGENWFPKSAPYRVNETLYPTPDLDSNLYDSAQFVSTDGLRLNQDRMMGYTFKGNYLPDPVTLTNEGDYVLDGNGIRWFGVNLPYTTDPSIEPIDDQNLQSNLGYVTRSYISERDEVGGWSVIKTPSQWIGETPRDTGFPDLQSSVEFAVDNGGVLELRGGEYTLSSRLTIPKDLQLTVINPTIIKFDPSIDCTDLSLIESTLGTLKINGATLTIDAQNNTGNGAAIASLQKYIQADSRVEVKNLPNGSAYFGSYKVNHNGSTMSGQGYFKQLITSNIKNGPMVYGTSLWWDESAPFECSFELGDDCIISCHSQNNTGVFAYLFNKLLYARVGGCLIKDDNGYYKSFNTNLENGDWTAQNNTTISKNTFTTTANGGIYTQLPGKIEIGEKYYVVLGGKTTSSAINVRNGSTAAAPIITSVLDQVASFEATSSSIYIQVIGAGTTQVSDFVVFKDSAVASNIFQCASADVEGTRYIGCRRGPVIGIDCKNFTVRATKTFGASITGLDIDLESLPDQPQLYPDAYGKVYENLCKYIGVRGLYSTARQVDYLNNTFYYAADSKDSLSKGCMRLNTKNEADSYSGVYVAGNRSFGNGNAPFINVYRGIVKIGTGNTHDSMSEIPFFTDKSTDTPDMISGFLFTNGGSGIVSIQNGVTIPSGNDVYKLTSEVTDFKLPAKTYQGCAGWKCQIVRNGNSNNIAITTVAGSVNGGGGFTWPSSQQIINIVCISDDNDFFIS